MRQDRYSCFQTIQVTFCVVQSVTGNRKRRNKLSSLQVNRAGVNVITDCLEIFSYVQGEGGRRSVFSLVCVIYLLLLLISHMFRATEVETVFFQKINFYIPVGASMLACTYCTLMYRKYSGSSSMMSTSTELTMCPTSSHTAEKKSPTESISHEIIQIFSTFFLESILFIKTAEWSDLIFFKLSSVKTCETAL